MSGDESFLARWSRRKQAGEAPVGQPDGTGETEAAETPPPVPEAKAEESFDLSKLPAIESLGKNSDYSMFMHNAVPEELRLKALRRMWTTDPLLAAPELLDIHAWDYTGNDGIKPLVSPALEALAAAAREVVERAKKAAAEKPTSPNSPAAEVAPGSRPGDTDKQSMG